MQSGMPSHILTITDYDFYQATHLIEEPCTPAQQASFGPAAQLNPPARTGHFPVVLATAGLDDVEPLFDDLDFGLGSNGGADPTSTLLPSEHAYQSHTGMPGQFGMDLTLDNGSSDRVVVKATDEEDAMRVLDEYFGESDLSSQLPDYQV